MRDRKLFVAGSTGAVGTALIQAAGSRGIPFAAHVRPRRAERGGTREDAAVFELSDEAALLEHLQECTTVLQLIGTMRSRFASGDTYEVSDVGTTRTLILGAKKAGIDHFVLLSSVGAGRPIGSYLKAKARAEAMVVDSGLPFTILRPSALVGRHRKVSAPLAWATRAMKLRRYRPILVEDLVDALLDAAVRREPLGRVLEGESLWELVRAAKHHQGGQAA